MGRIKIYPSILSADFSRLEEEIRRVEEAGADGIHLDVMDGHFVPNISFGPVVIRSIRPVTDLPFWAHLMIEDPMRYAEAFAGTGIQGIFVHVELNTDPVEMAAHIHRLGCKAGLTINPDTPVDAVLPYLDHYERLLFMTVHPGFGGQEFMETPLEKIRTLRKGVLRDRNLPQIEVDGGVDRKTAPCIAEAGADILVAGSAIFRAENPADALNAIRTAADRTLNQPGTH